jgi:hypothetical protein
MSEHSGFQPTPLTPEQVHKFAREYMEHGVVYVAYHGDRATVFDFADIAAKISLPTIYRPK